MAAKKPDTELLESHLETASRMFEYIVNAQLKCTECDHVGPLKDAGGTDLQSWIQDWQNLKADLQMY